MAEKEAGKDQKKNSRSQSQLVKLAVVFLAGVSLFTTAQGMNKYIFKNDAIAYTASTAIQGILLAMSMGLPGYLRGIWENKKNVFWRFIACAIIVLLTFVTMFCSSWFSYVHIAEFVHNESWGTESELLVQQTYREELYNARDYSHSYRTYLEGETGRKILLLEEQADRIFEEEQLDNPNINLEQDKAEYENENSIAGSYMATVIEAMENAMGSNSSADSRDLAAKAVTDAQDNIKNRMEEIQQELDRHDASIARYREQMETLRRSITNAVAGTDTTGLTNSLNSYVQQIESETAMQAALQEEYNQLDTASKRLQYYENILGLNNESSSIAIRNQLLEMQSEFFQDNPDEEKLLASATSVFENLRSAASYNEDNSLSYTDLLVQMNQLILNLKDYSDIKVVESSLEDLIVELREERETNSDSVESINSSTEENRDQETEEKEDPENGESENSNTDKNEESNNIDTGENGDQKKEENTNADDRWKIIWRNRLEMLKAQISSMPVYNVEQTTDQNEESILTDAQLSTLLGYDRNASSNRLDNMIRLYIAEHNALYQGIIYLRSPYKMLALFSLLLAVSFDLSGFILGFISQGEDIKESSSVGDILNDEKMNRRAKKMEHTTEWSILPTLNKYKILTGDYERKDDIYSYQVFEDGLLRTWEVKDADPYIQGIYLQDKKSETKGSLVSATEQDVRFASQEDGPTDGVYLNCCLEFEEGSLLLVRDVNHGKAKSFLANINEYVPVHSYNPSKGENQTIPAEWLSKEKIKAKMAILALNEKGTRVAAIYIVEQ